MGTLTANLKFQKPQIGGDDVTWGDDFGDPENEALDGDSPGLNGNWSKLDAILKANDDKIAELTAILDGLPDELEKLRIQVGGLYVTRDATDPATRLGYGTWTAWGGGRAMVGKGPNNNVGDEYGEADVTLTTAQMPSHTHSSDPPQVTSSSSGDHNHTYTSASTSTVSKGTGSGGSLVSAQSSQNTNSTGAHTHTVDIAGFTSGSAGSNQAHNNLMPSKAAYIWQRTA